MMEEGIASNRRLDELPWGVDEAPSRAKILVCAGSNDRGLAPFIQNMRKLLRELAVKGGEDSRMIGM
jgi:hypothetical protein